MRTHLIRFGAIAVISLSAMVAEAQTPLFPAYDGKNWGYVDSGRRFVIEPRFELAGPFVQGLAPVKSLTPDKSEGKYGSIDPKGNWKIEPRFLMADVFSEGLSAVKVDDRYGYIDISGKQVIDARFEWAGPFHQNRAVVFSQEKCGYIDKKGEIKINAQYNRARPFSEGLAAISRGGERFGYINQQGTVMIEPKFRIAGEFHEGLAWFQDIDGLYGFINNSGNVIIHPKYDRVNDFLNGYAVVKSNKRLMMINNKGEEIHNGINKYDSIERSSDRNFIAMKGHTPSPGFELGDGGLVFQQADHGENPFLTDVTFESIPANAKVFNPSLWDYKHTTNKRDLLTPMNQISSGNTNVTEALDNMNVYMVIFVINDKLECRLCRPIIHKKISVIFK